MVSYYVLSYVQDVYMYGMCSCSIKASSSGVTNRWTEVDWTRLENVRNIKSLNYCKCSILFGFYTCLILFSAVYQLISEVFVSPVKCSPLHFSNREWTHTCSETVNEHHTDTNCPSPIMGPTMPWAYHYYIKSHAISSWLLIILWIRFCLIL